MIESLLLIMAAFLLLMMFLSIPPFPGDDDEDDPPPCESCAGKGWVVNPYLGNFQQYRQPCQSCHPSPGEDERPPP